MFKRVIRFINILHLAYQNLSKEDILLMVEDLPLYVALTISRLEHDSPTPIISKHHHDSDTKGTASPNGLNIKVIFIFL